MNNLKKIDSFITGKKKIFFQKILTKYFKGIVRDKPFTVISNDCWAGEIYKLLGREFNTPFIGLMMMSPCYISLLKDLRSNLSNQLKFVANSKYPAIEKIRSSHPFPVAVLGDTGIEISFLHYSSESIAGQKWNRRVKRIDWDHLFVKYDCGKDYASDNDVSQYLTLPLSSKLVFGKQDYGKKEVIVTREYSTDATRQFINCFLHFNPFGWLAGQSSFKNRLDKFMCRMAYVYL